MSYVKTLTLSLCITIVIFSIISTITPNEKNGKIIKLILSVFILISLISPFTKMVKSDFKLTEQSDVFISDNSISNVLNSASDDAIYRLLKTPIESFGIDNDFSVVTEVEYENNSAILKEINVYLLGENNIDKNMLMEYIEKTIGLRVNIK